MLVLLLCCWEPSCERQADAIFRQQFELCCTHLPDRPSRPEFVPSSGILCRHLMRIWLCFLIFFFLFCILPGLGGSTFLLSKFLASFLATIRSISFPVVFCIVGIRYRFSLLWSHSYVTNPQEPVLLRRFLRTV